jgi:hypothetical protein
MKFSLQKFLLIVTLGLFTSILSAAGLPKFNYACHVITENKNIGVNFVQVNSEKQAYDGALEVDAYVNDEGKTEMPAAVMQCIILPGNKFNDYTAQKLLDSIPR